jgi:hypothetical protein
MKLGTMRSMDIACHKASLHPQLLSGPDLDHDLGMLQVSLESQ